MKIEFTESSKKEPLYSFAQIHHEHGCFKCVAQNVEHLRFVRGVSQSGTPKVFVFNPGNQSIFVAEYWDNEQFVKVQTQITLSFE